LLQQKTEKMKVGQIITGITGDKKGLQGEILAIDSEKQRVQIKWPKGYMKTWVKTASVK
jgi:ribosomal protein L24